jgi:hypothetical protein
MMSSTENGSRTVKIVLAALFSEFARRVGTVRIKDMSQPATEYDTARFMRANAKRDCRNAKRIKSGERVT